MKLLKQTLLTFIFSGLAFGIFMGLVSAGLGNQAAATAGAIGGASFGALIALFVFVAELQVDKVRKDFLPNVEPVKSGGANIRRGKEMVGGWLFLTDDSLFFKSHAINYQTVELRIPIRTITKIEKIRFYGIVPNGLALHTAEGVEVFALSDRNSWVTMLDKAQTISAKRAAQND